MSPQEIYQLAVSQGFSPQAAVTMTAIALAESSGNPGAVSKPNTNGTIDRGLFQINSVHQQYDQGMLVNDPGYNTRAAFQLSGGGKSFQPWSTYNSGAYKKYLSQAQAAAGGSTAAGYTGGTAKAMTEAAKPQDLGTSLKQASDITVTGGAATAPVLSPSGQPDVVQPTTAKGLGGITATGSAPSGAVPTDTQATGPAATAINIALGAARNKTPYVWGGNSLQAGVDCSGLIQEAYKAAGINLPRVSNDQIAAGTPVDPKDMMPGDLLGWAYNGSLGGGATHIAMYIGGGKMVEALHKGEPVHVVDVRTPQFVSRITADSHGAPAPTTVAQPQNSPNDSLESRLAAIGNAFSAALGSGSTDF